jgi:hypothetical protein
MTNVDAEAIETLRLAFERWTWALIEGNTAPAVDIVAEFTKPSIQALDGLKSLDGNIYEFSRFEISRRTGLVEKWEVTIKGPGRATVGVKLLKPAEFIQLTTVIDAPEAPKS